MKKVLLVDGNNLFKIGYHGVKNMFHKGNHIGAIYHFMNTLKNFLKEYNYDKVIVFWDDKENSLQRKLIYPNYKANRKEKLNKFQLDSYNWQQKRLKEYLEEVFIRQISIEGNEADDMIAYYCQISENEKKTIFSSDVDLTQLINENVEIYQPSTKNILKNGDKVKLHEIEVPHQNICVFKIINGDNSDNIAGIRYMGEKTINKLFPMITERVVSLNEILRIAEDLHKNDKDNRAIQNLLSGKTKYGIYGDEFFQINEKIINLSTPLLTDEARDTVEQYYNEDLDPEGRSYKNLMKMMTSDGIFKFLPKYDDAWVDFIRPFTKLTRKETKKNVKRKKYKNE